MLVETLLYADFTASLVQYVAGESHFIEPMSEQKPCIGVLFLSGSWKLHNSGVESGPEDLGLHIPNPDGTWPRAFWNEYNENDYCEAGPDGVEWICIEANDSGPRGLTLAQGPLTLPANTGALVTSGYAVIGDVTPMLERVPSNEIVDGGNVFRLYRDPVALLTGKGRQMDYFSLADTDRDVIGSGQVLLVTR